MEVSGDLFPRLDLVELVCEFLARVPQVPISLKGRYAPPVRMVKLSEVREISPYKWVHPDEER